MPVFEAIDDATAELGRRLEQRIVAPAAATSQLLQFAHQRAARPSVRRRGIVERALKCSAEMTECVTSANLAVSTRATKGHRSAAPGPGGVVHIWHGSGGRLFEARKPRSERLQTNKPARADLDGR